MGRGLLNIVIGGAMVVGGLSGGLVLRGTSSGGALAAIGSLVVGLGLYRVVQANRQNGGGDGGGSTPSA